MNDQTLRIIQIMQDKKMSATQFSEAIGIQRSKMSHLTLGRNNPTADVITKIITRFEDINPGWLLTGKGAMKIVPVQPDDLMDEHQFYKKNLFDNQFNKENSDEYESRKNVVPLMYPDASDIIPSVPTRKTQHNTSVESVIRTSTYPQEENRPAEEVNQAGNATKIIEKEIVTNKEWPVKKIEKLVIFFSDKTYETFISES